jgi:hypothetical protein
MAFKGPFIMTFRSSFQGPILRATGLAILATLTVSPARADRCDDIASQLKSGIDGLTVGRTAAGVIYLSHPQAKDLTLGCPSRNFSNQLFAKTDRKPKPQFLDLVANAAAIIFTLPKDGMRQGASRCMGRLGLFRDDVATRYRRLEMRCTRTKTDASITISRRLDE